VKGARARRRAELEIERQRLAAERAAREARLARRRELRRKATAWVPKPIRVARQRGYLARRRRTQNGLVIVLWFLIQVIAWILLSGWMARLGVFLLSILLIPVLVTVVFDRRS
jgi:cytochrome b subunit of formate dehydrogenase